MKVRLSRNALLLVATLLALTGCQKSASETSTAQGSKIGLVTDVGGRGDRSFNDSALRGLENWAADMRYQPSGYRKLSAEERSASLALMTRTPGQEIPPVAVQPVVLHARQQEDYEANLQLLVEDGVKLAIGVGFMLENSVESAARKNPDAHFLLIDSTILDATGTPYELPNVQTITFREHEGAFLVGAIAGLVTKSQKIGFVGGMQIPLIRRFEVGFRAGVRATNPEAAAQMLIAYTGSFNRADAGKQVAQDMIAKGADVLFHAAGADGLGVIAAAREAERWAIGCDSDQHDVAPEAVLTSLVKHVDWAVYRAAVETFEGRYHVGHTEMGLKEGGLGLAPLRTDKLGEEEKATLLKKVETLRQQIVDGTLLVPATIEAFDAGASPSKPPAPPARRESAGS